MKMKLYTKTNTLLKPKVRYVKDRKIKKRAPPGIIPMTTILEFVTGWTGPRRMQAPAHFPRPAPLNRLGRVVFFGIPYPCPRSGPCPTHTRDGSLLKIGGNKQGPV